MTAINRTDDSWWSKLDQFSDKRTRGWFLVDSPTNVALLILGYLLMVWCGPKFMEKREPLKFKRLLVVYNFALVLLNLHLVKDILIGTSRLGYEYLCKVDRMDQNPEEMKILNAIWLFYISKSVEFADTLFFILRKKSNQLSGLHVYHHCTMLIYCWTNVKWYPGGANARLPAMNSFVHVVMYLYYGLSAMGPKVRKYLWWKKYLTSLQLVQFTISIAWSVNSIIKGCNHHVSIDTWNILYMCTFLYLFGKFYLQKYTKKVK